MLFSTWIRSWKRSLDRRWALQQTLGRRRDAHRRASRPRLEALEDRCLLSSYVVTTTEDNGSNGIAGTLRDAINKANAPGSTITEIDFSIGNVGTAQLMPLANVLPALTANGVAIKGLSQGGSGNTVQLITLDWTGIGSGGPALLLQGSNCTVSGLILESWKNGIEVAGSNNTVGGTTAGMGNIISGSVADGVLIDSNVSGVQVQGNSVQGDFNGIPNFNGIEIKGSNNTIGGNSEANYYLRNFISGNGKDGVLIDSGATGNQVQGNFIGLDISGTHGVSNSNGIEIAGNGNSIGSATFGTGNVISGNKIDGVKIDSGATGNLLLGNLVGTDYTGSGALANSIGVEIGGNSNTLGGTASAARNILSGNKLDGVQIDSGTSGNQVLGNYIGVGSSNNALANSIGVEDSGSGNTIGGAVAFGRNFISGNSNDGIRLDSSATAEMVVSNFIGLTPGGNSALANGTNGIEIMGNNNIIGGNSQSNYYDLNFISGNSNDGVLIAVGATGNQVQGNFIGLDISGTHGVGNGLNGIRINGNSNGIGSTTFGTGNVISGNGNDGVRIESGAVNLLLGNFVGTDYTGNGAIANSIGIEFLGNSNTLGSSVSSVRNIISGNKTDGVKIDSGASGNQVLGNFIGLGSAGSALANSIGVEDGSSGNTIGGAVAFGRNFISGNSSDGILLDSTAKTETVVSNFIGLGLDGNTALANGTNGIEIKGNSNTIGGNSQSNYYARNFLSGNGNDGVLIDSGATGNQVQGNLIGVGVNGTTGVGNSINGIEIIGNGNSIGSTTFGTGNVISSNKNDGVLVASGATGNLLLGNLVGTDYTGSSALANSIGVEIGGNSNTLGGTASAAHNILSGNKTDGVKLDSGTSGNQILGNYIGVGSSNSALANSVGVEDGGSGNTIGGAVAFGRNFISGNSTDGILLDSTATAETVLSNFIGLGIDGSTALANGSNGIEIKGNSNTVGGNSQSNYYDLNFISGNNDAGVLIDSGATGNQVQGNFIGLDISGTHGVGNSIGIEVAGNGNTVGSTTFGTGNFVSGNSSDGVRIDSSATGNVLLGNFVGTDYTGSGVVANSGNGVEILANSNTIGGSVAGAGNTIANNHGDGVLVSAGNGNTISRNSIYANTAAGISLASGANNDLAAPILSSATLNVNTLTVMGTFTAPTANVSYVLEFFANLSGDAEGRVYLGTLTLTPSSMGTQNFTFNTTTSVTATYPLITATLTDNTGDTSAFSNGVTTS